MLPLDKKLIKIKNDLERDNPPSADVSNHHLPQNQNVPFHHQENYFPSHGKSWSKKIYRNL